MYYSGIIEQIKGFAPTISANIIDCNVMELARHLKLIEESGLHILHFDVMDGCFVPTMTIGPCFIRSIKTNLLKEVQLFIHDPAEKVEDFINAGADILTLHIESDYNLLETLIKLQNTPSKNDPRRPVLRGLAINPDIPVEDIAPFIHEIEVITVMAYNPKIKHGRVDDHLAVRVEKIRKMIEYTKREIILCINGNLDTENVNEFRNLEADIYTSGKYIFKNEKVKENIEKLLSKLK